MSLAASGEPAVQALRRRPLDLVVRFGKRRRSAANRRNSMRIAESFFFFFFSPFSFFFFLCVSLLFSSFASLAAVRGAVRLLFERSLCGSCLRSSERRRTRCSV